MCARGNNSVKFHYKSRGRKILLHKDQTQQAENLGRQEDNAVVNQKQEDIMKLMLEIVLHLSPYLPLLQPAPMTGHLIKSPVAESHATLRVVSAEESSLLDITILETITTMAARVCHGSICISRDQVEGFGTITLRSLKRTVAEGLDCILEPGVSAASLCWIQPASAE